MASMHSTRASNSTRGMQPTPRPYEPEIVLIVERVNLESCKLWQPRART